MNEGNPSNGTSFLMVRFPADGTEWEASVGPFRFPPARIGESLMVVYDPRDLSNVETPEQMTSGKLAVAFMVLASAMLVLSAAMFVLG
ncbi:hypothetical protein OH809_22735 [Streptomyces sp. NBC_00873]|uniref:hypothetical protein n=1 Tax=unclassified Streptomyces TaxID=2593676 RepID=UPI00386E469D|nr:hypothetical protein OH809_22735 [Streptomyces sp. NBC_00873]WTA44722.1 hypothetical protein OH821_20560 [Streptomyces sp. NBC_00842]